mgnify:CR=1 FL=1
MTIEIRSLTSQDEAVWRELWTGYLTFYESSVSEEVYASTFERLLTEGDYEPSGYIAWDGDVAVGLVHFMYHRHCWRTENVCYLQDLFAAPEARGKGAGRALIEAVYAQADDKGQLLSRLERHLREQYEEQVQGLTRKAEQLEQEGIGIPAIATAMHAERRALGIDFKNRSAPEARDRIYERNLERYGDKLGPTLEYLVSDGKSWEDIIESAARPGGGDLN